MSERMLQGFALYREPAAQPRGSSAYMDQDTLATPPGTRLMRIIRLYHGWRLWTATRDFKFGTYLELFDDGRVLNCTSRVDEGDELFWSRPSDEEIRSTW
jgi:hypothetical protein